MQCIFTPLKLFLDHLEADYSAYWTVRILIHVYHTVGELTDTSYKCGLARFGFLSNSRVHVGISVTLVLSDSLQFHGL